MIGGESRDGRGIEAVEFAGPYSQMWKNQEERVLRMIEVFELGKILCNNPLTNRGLRRDMSDMSEGRC